MKNLTKLLILLGLLSQAACMRPINDKINDARAEIQAELDEMEQNQETNEQYLIQLETRVNILEQAAENNVQIHEFVNPCGENERFVDELLIVTNIGIMAWYQDVGLAVLEDGAYYTTDSDSCKFMIEDGHYIEGHDRLYVSQEINKR